MSEEEKIEIHESPKNIENQVLPEMWNPAAAVNWSIVFTPVFGSWLQMKNWEQLGHSDEAKKCKFWLILSLLYTCIIPFVEIPRPFSNIGPICLLLPWYIFSGKFQMDYFKKTQLEYTKKSWVKPISIGLVVMAVYIGTIMNFVTIPSGDLKEILAKESVPLVDKIVKDQLKLSTHCQELELDDSVIENNFTGRAYMSDGSIYQISVEFDGKNIYLKILKQIQ